MDEIFEALKRIRELCWSQEDSCCSCPFSIKVSDHIEHDCGLTHLAHELSEPPCDWDMALIWGILERE